MNTVEISPPRAHSNKGKELIESVCPQYLGEAIRGHLSRFDALSDDYSLLLQIANVVVGVSQGV